MEHTSSADTCNVLEGAIECRAEAILRGMDDLLVGIVDLRPSPTNIGSPEREVHVDEQKRASLMKSRANSVEGLHDGYSKPSRIVCKNQNPEDTAPMNITYDTVSLLSSNASSNSIVVNATPNSLMEQREKFLFGDDESEVSLLLNEEGEEATVKSFLPEDESVVCIQKQVDAIRQEASKVEAALAIQKLQTLKSELRSMTKLVQVQADQIEHLKKEVKTRDNAIAMMELERDLWIADMEALRDLHRGPPPSCDSVERDEMQSSVDSLTSASSSLKDPDIGHFQSMSEAQSSSEATTQDGTKSFEGSFDDVTPLGTRSSSSMGTNRFTLGSPLESVSSGGSTELERYLCNLDFGALQERRKPNPRAATDIAPMATVSVASEGKTDLSVLSTGSSRAARTLPFQEQPKACVYGMSVRAKQKFPAFAQRSSQVSHRSNTEGDGSSTLDGANAQCEVSPLAERSHATAIANANLQIATVPVPSGVELINIRRSQSRSNGFHCVQGNPINKSQDASSHSSSRGSSQGSSKENRVAKATKKPSRFKPIHPPTGFQKSTSTKTILAPLPRKAQSPPQELVSDVEKSNDSNTHGRPSPYALVTGSTLRRIKAHRSGAFPTDQQTKHSTTDLDGGRPKSKMNAQMPGASVVSKLSSKERRESVSSKCLESRDSLQIQVEELAQRLRTSVEGSEDLKKRLAMISRYYETTVQRLSENIVSLKQEQASMQGDLTRQIQSIDRERLVAMKRTELLLKEQQIAKFKKKQRNRF